MSEHGVMQPISWAYPSHKGLAGVQMFIYGNIGEITRDLFRNLFHFIGAMAVSDRVLAQSFRPLVIIIIRRAAVKAYRGAIVQ